MSGADRFIGVFLLLSALASAQGIEVEAVRQGAQRFDISVDAKNQPALEYISAMASACGFALDIRKPEISSALAKELLNINLQSESLEEAVSLLAMACGFDGRVELADERIVIDFLPSEEDGAEAIEFRRKQALRALLVAYGDSDDAQDEVELLLRTARLQLDGGEFSQAFDTYDSFLRDYRKHGSAPDAALGAAHAAFIAERHGEVQRVVQDFIGDFPDSLLIGRAQIIAARSRLLTGDLGGGIALLKNIIRGARTRDLPQRDGIIAELILAEALHQRGEDEAAIRGLSEAEIRYDRKIDEDLLRQIRFYMAICRRALGNSRDALHDLELAAFEVPSPELRVRTMMLHAELLLEAGDPFLALTSAKVALRFEPTGRRLFEVKRTISRALRAMQLQNEASAAMLAVVLEAPSLLPDPEERRREVSEALREIGSIYLDQGLVRDAVTSFKTVISAAEHHAAESGPSGRELVAECRFLIAVSQHKAGEWKEAIATLDSIIEGISSESLAKDIRRLKGDCYLASGMPEAAMRVWREGETR